MSPTFRRAIFRKDKGSMTVLALFIIIVLGLLAATMTSVVNNTSASVVNEVYGVRVQQAARAGLESLIAQSFPVGSTAQSCQTTISSPATFSQIAGMQSCRFVARCDSEDIEFLGVDYRYYKYVSTGSCDLADSVISRTISVDAMETL